MSTTKNPKLEFYLSHAQSSSGKARDDECQPAGWVFAFLMNQTNNLAQTRADEVDSVELEHDIHGVWALLIQVASQSQPNSEAHLRLIYNIQYFQSMICPQTTDRKAVRTTDGILWRDLPFLCHDLQQAWSKHAAMTVEARTNFAAFLAQLCAINIFRKDLLRTCAMSLFKEALETEETERFGPPLQDLLPALVQWLKFASRRLFLASNTSSLTAQNIAPGPRNREGGIEANGFSPDRWTFWESALEQLSQLDNGGISLPAKAGSAYMMELRSIYHWVGEPYKDPDETQEGVQSGFGNPSADGI